MIEVNSRGSSGEALFLGGNAAIFGIKLFARDLRSLSPKESTALRVEKSPAEVERITDG